MSEELLVNTSLDLIRKDFGLEESFTLKTVDYREEILKELEHIVQYLLDNDFEKLLNTMYRIDLPEIKVKKVLSTENPENLSRVVSVMILDRELEKARTRIEYSK